MDFFVIATKELSMAWLQISYLLFYHQGQDITTCFKFCDWQSHGQLRLYIPGTFFLCKHGLSPFCSLRIWIARLLLGPASFRWRKHGDSWTFIFKCFEFRFQLNLTALKVFGSAMASCRGCWIRLCVGQDLAHYWYAVTFTAYFCRILDCFSPQIST